MNKTINQIWINYLPNFVKSRLEGQYTLQDIIGNTSWLFADKIIRMGLGLFVGVWVARYLGPSDYGILNYTVSFVALFSFVAASGIESVVIRELVRNPSEKDRIIGSSMFIKFVGSFIALILILYSISTIHSKDKVIFMLALVISCGFIFQVFDVIDYWFQSQVLSKYTVWARNIAFLVASLAKILLIAFKASIVAFAIVGTFETFLGALGLLLIYRRNGFKISRLRIDVSIIKMVLLDGWPLLLSSLTIIIYMRIDQVMIGQMMGNKELGLYSVAVMLSEIWYFVPVAIASSVFPSILNARETEEIYNKYLKMLYDLMAGISIIIGLLVSLFSGWIVSTLYGAQYDESKIVLSIYIWAGIPVFLGVASSQYLIGENLTRISLYRTIIGCITNVVLNFILIPKYGINGSAIATLISYSIATFFIFIPKETRKQGVFLLNSLNILRHLTLVFKRRI